MSEPTPYETVKSNLKCIADTFPDDIKSKRLTKIIDEIEHTNMEIADGTMRELRDLTADTTIDNRVRGIGNCVGEMLLPYYFQQ